MLVKSLKTFLKSVGVVALALWTFTFLVSFSDGPTEIFPGGDFTSGKLVTGEPDWSFAKNLSNVEFQTMNPVSSRTTFIMIQDNRVFIPSGYMTTWWGKIWKQWPYQARLSSSASDHDPSPAHPAKTCQHRVLQEHLPRPGRSQHLHLPSTLEALLQRDPNYDKREP